MLLTPARLLPWVIAIGLTAFVHAAEPPPPASPVNYRFVAGAGEVPLLVAEAGDPAAPGILFIHGMAQSHLAFHRQFEDPRLTTRFHLVAFDLRGQGGSGKPWRPQDYRDPQTWAQDIAAVLRATGLRRPVVVAWSYGGFVVMDYVRVFGAQGLAGIMMVGSLGGLTAIPRFSGGESEEARAMRDRSAAQRGLDLQAFITASEAIGGSYATPAMNVRERQNFFATEILTPAYVRMAMTSRSLDNRDLAEKLAGVPLLFIRGSKDLTMPTDALRRLLDQIPGSRLSGFDGAGHLPFMEMASRFDDELTEFARRSGAE